MKALICSALLASASLAAPTYAATAGMSATSAQNNLPPGCKYVLWILICDEMPI